MAEKACHAWHLHYAARLNSGVRPHMKQFDDLMMAYVASGFDSVIVEHWYADSSPSGESLSYLAESIGAAFLAGRIDFDAASGLLNKLMPLVGFEAAPTRFWQYYTAFEDFGTSNDPDTDAKPAISALTSSSAA
jgi:hypothetical protein